MKFCPKCGKKTDELYDGLCKACSKEKIFDYKAKNVHLCPICGRGSIKASLKDNIETSLNKTIHYNLPVHEPKEKTNVDFEFTLRLKGEFNGQRIDQEHILPARVKYVLCSSCQKKNTEYFQGIIQIRGYRPKKALDYLKSIIDKKRSSFITKEKKVKNGYDVYVTSSTEELARKLHRAFGGELKANEQVFSMDRQTSKIVYRVNALVRVPAYEAGDVIKMDDRLLRVEKINGNYVNVLDLIHNKRHKVRCDDYSLVKKDKDIKETSVLVTRPDYQVLNPETYQGEMVSNPGMLRGKKEGDKINAFIYKGTLWVV